MAVLRRLPRLDMVQDDALLFAPRHKVPAAELGAVVAPQRLRLPKPFHDPLKRSRHPADADAAADLNGRTFARVIVHNRQRPEPAPAFSPAGLIRAASPPR